MAVLEEASYPEQSVSIDEIPGTDFFGGGPVRTYTLEPDLHRVYAASNYSGAVVEYELDARGTTPTFTHLSTWQDPTHSDQVGDCIPYDVGHASGLPFILVSRFRQTVAILAASGLLP